MAAKKRRRQPKTRNLPTEIAKYISSCFIALVVLVLVINLYDPELHPGVATAMRVTPSYISEKENAYFSLYGLGVPANENPHAYGVRHVAVSNALVEDFYRAPKAESVDLATLPTRDETVKWQGETSELCKEPRVHCVSAYAKQRTAVHRLARDNSLRLARYRSLYRYKQFQETILQRIELNSIPALASPEHETVLAQIALNVVDGNTGQALRDLEADTTYWRRVLAGASSLVVKVVASNYLSRNYALASEIASRHRSDPDVIAHVARLTQPLSSDEKSWSAPVTSEFHMTAHFYTRLGAGSEHGFFGQEQTFWESILLALFYKPNASINRLYAHYEKVLLLATAPAPDFAKASKAVQKSTASLADPSWTRYLYNPMGNLLIATGAIDSYPRYIGRTHNLDGQIRLLRVQLAIYKNGVAPKDMTSWLDRRAPDDMDPFRNQPFQWDAATQELWFEGIPLRYQDQAPHRIAVRL